MIQVASNVPLPKKIQTSRNIPTLEEVQEEKSNIIENYKKLNDKCDLVLEKIKQRQNKSND